MSRSAIAPASAAMRLLLLRVDDVELALCRLERRARPGIGGERLLVVGIRLLEALHRGGAILRQAAVAVDVVLRAGDLGRGRGQLGLRLGDHRFLQPAVGLEIRQRRLLPGDRGGGLRQRRAIVAIVELHQQVAGMHRLVVGHRDLGDEARHLGRDHRDVAADIGIVGALDEAPDGPPMMAVPGRPDADQQRRAGETELPARQAGMPHRRPRDDARARAPGRS